MTASAPFPDETPHARPTEAVLAALGVDPARGLTDDEAVRRRAQVGDNVLPTRPLPGRVRLLLDQLRVPLAGVLLAAALVSGLLLHEWLDAGVILAILALDAALGFVQHARAEDALAALREVAAPDAEVVRDGKRRRIAAATLVPGDVVLLDPGDRVPADARVVEPHGLVLDESTLTGESLPAEKRREPVDPETPLADRDSMVFLGTTVRSGRGRVVVTAIGAATEMGAVARLIETREEPPTPLQVELGGVGRRLAVLATGVAAIVFGLGLLRHFPAEEMFLTAVALAVAAIPEGLPAAVTITMARGVQRLVRAHALVRRLPAVETLGAADVICTDKTGTLTSNRLQVAAVVPEDALIDRSRFALVVSLCSDAPGDGSDGTVGDPTELALLRTLHAAGVDPEVLRRDHPRLDEAGFDPTRKRMSTLHPLDGGYLVAVKGAPELLLEQVVLWNRGGVTVPLGDYERIRLRADADALAARGLRTLALAYRTVAERPLRLETAEHDLVLVAIVGLLDEVRAEAAPAIAEATAAGIRVVMVTGDHAATAETVGRDLGLVDGPDQVLDGRHLHHLDKAELARNVTRIRAYARVDPADKVKIVDAWRARGAVVAMTGDGVNDGPALRAADIGIAMGSGSDVGKDTAALVLADDNFATIVAAIREGRRIFLNLQKIVWFLLAANAAEMLVVAVGLLAFGDSGSPLLPTHILWINLVTDGLPVLALAVDPAPRDVMERAPRGRRPLLGRRDQARMLGRGVVLATATLGAFGYGHFARDLPWPHVRTLVFTTLVIVQLAYVFAVRRAPGGDSRSAPAPNRFLAWSVAGSFALQVAVVHTPAGQALFDTVALTATDWLVILGLTAAAATALARPGPGGRRTGRSAGPEPSGPWPLAVRPGSAEGQGAPGGPEEVPHAVP